LSAKKFFTYSEATEKQNRFWEATRNGMITPHLTTPEEISSLKIFRADRRRKNGLEIIIKTDEKCPKTGFLPLLPCVQKRREAHISFSQHGKLFRI
jgi:hypothetical protein